MSTNTPIDVDEDFHDAEGNDYKLYASPEPVAEGYMMNTPCTVRTPDGVLHKGNVLTVTPAGMKWLDKVLPDHLREARH